MTEPLTVQIIAVCPRCAKVLPAGWTYRVGYEADNFRTIPPVYGRGGYCEHWSPERLKVEGNSDFYGASRSMLSGRMVELVDTGVPEPRPEPGCGASFVRLGAAVLVWGVLFALVLAVFWGRA